MLPVFCCLQTHWAKQLVAANAESQSEAFIALLIVKQSMWGEGAKWGDTLPEPRQSVSAFVPV